MFVNTNVFSCTIFVFSATLFRNCFYMPGFQKFPFHELLNVVLLKSLRWYCSFIFMLLLLFIDKQSSHHFSLDRSYCYLEIIKSHSHRVEHYTCKQNILLFLAPMGNLFWLTQELKHQLNTFLIFGKTQLISYSF